MEPVLLVSASETAAAQLRPLLDAAGCRRTVTARTGGDAAAGPRRKTSPWF